MTFHSLDKYTLQTQLQGQFNCTLSLSIHSCHSFYTYTQILDQVSGNVGDAQSVAARNNPMKNRSTDFLPGFLPHMCTSFMYPSCACLPFSGQMESCFERRKSRLHTRSQYQSRHPWSYISVGVWSHSVFCPYV